jgi:hypothetical protein
MLRHGSEREEALMAGLANLVVLDLECADPAESTNQLHQARALRPAWFHRQHLVSGGATETGGQRDQALAAVRSGRTMSMCCLQAGARRQRLSAPTTGGQQVRLAKGLLVSAAAIVAASLWTTASATAAPVPIGPNQYFSGLVNGTHNNAVIKMVCPGPSSGQLGHPASGQTVSVTQLASTTAGFTGSLANSIAVTFGTQSGTAGITLKYYDTPAAIPTTLLLPCSGTGQVRYDPEPTSPTARADVVTVTFVNIAA